MDMTIAELASTAAAAVEAADVRGANGRVTELPDARTIRYYSTIGLLDRPSGNRGRTALYGERHVLQLVAIKRRQAQGRTLAEIQTELVGATDRTLRRIAAIELPVSVPAAAKPAAPRSFWREAPAETVELTFNLALADGVALTLPRRPDAADVAAIRAAAQPLLDLLADRRLTNPPQSHREGGPR